MNQNESPVPTAPDEMQTAQVLMQSDRWMATLAHELRNPLGAIMMSLEELRSCCAADCAARLTREIAMDAARHMAGVIDDALELCRAHRDKVQFRTERVDLVKIISAAIRNSQPVIARKKHHVTLELPLGKVMLEAHPIRLEQIVTNLLTNSANYTNPGGRISIVIETAANVVALRVQDNGAGISSDCMTKIFEPYWKSPASDGLGIGLALVKSLVELHGGTIAVHSDGIGKGAEFVVRLPVVAQHAVLPNIDA